MNTPLRPIPNGYAETVHEAATVEAHNARIGGVGQPVVSAEAAENIAYRAGAVKTLSGGWLFTNEQLRAALAWRQVNGYTL